MQSPIVVCPVCHGASTTATRSRGARQEIRVNEQSANTPERRVYDCPRCLGAGWVLRQDLPETV